MVSVVNDRDFSVLEESLDWLETTGILVERFDPAVMGRARSAGRETDRPAA